MGRKIKISPSAIIYSSSAKIKASAEIGEFSIIGKKTTYLKGNQPAVVKENCIIGAHVTIYEGAAIKRDTQIEDYCRIGEKTVIGSNCRLIYGAKIYGYVTIGNNCIIGGFICEEVKIGNNCRIFGELVHNHKIHPCQFHNLTKWDEGGELAPTIEDNVFIGFGAKIIGKVTIGRCSYILPNAIVNEDVPPHTRVKRVNERDSITNMFPPKEKNQTT